MFIKLGKGVKIKNVCLTLFLHVTAGNKYTLKKNSLKYIVLNPQILGKQSLSYEYILPPYYENTLHVVQNLVQKY